MAVKYDKNTDYAAKMNAAKKSGDTKAYNEAKAQREAKMAGEGLNDKGQKINTPAPKSNANSGQNNKAAATIYNPDGTISAGYIQNGATYYADGSRMGIGATVKAPNGQYYQMTAKGGIPVSGPQQFFNKPQTVDLINDTTVTKPSAMTADQLSKMYGVTYDFHTLNNILQDAAEKKFDVATADAKQVENQLYDTSYNLQGDMVNALKKGAGTVNQGAAKGTFDANTLLSLLGYQQQVSDLATTTTQDRQQLGIQLALDKANATQMAMDNANKAGVDLANLAALFGSNDTQFGVGTMDALARIYQANTDSKIAGTNAAANIAAAKTSSSGYSGGNSNTGNTSAYNNISDIVEKGNYADFYYLMSQTGKSDKEIKNLWKELRPEEINTPVDTDVLSNAALPIIAPKGYHYVYIGRAKHLVKD